MIPKIIHRVWLGPNQPHSDDIAFTQAWADMYPGHQVRVWTDETVDELRPLYLDDVYERSPTWVHRADIVMVEAVYRQGGMLAGWDMEPTRPITPLTEGSEGWCTLDADGYPGGGLFGAVPGHPALRTILAVIQRRARRGFTGKPNRDTGPWAWNEALGPTGRMPEGLDVVAGPEAAYPIHWKRRHLLDDPAVLADLRARSDVYAIHYFRASWHDREAVRV